MEGYAQEYYGGASDFDAATVFTVSDISDTTSGIDFSLGPFMAVEDGYEQNNTYETAHPISYGDNIGAVINPAGDEDWFTFTGQAGDTVTADIDARVTRSWLDSYISLYDSTGTYKLISNDDADGLDSRIDQYVLPYAGDYYLQVEEYSSHCGYPEGGDNYWYALQLIEGSIPFVPDPVFKISYDETVTDMINPSGDVDYFIFAGQAGDTITADITTGEDGYWLDSYLELLDSSGTVLAANDDWDGLDSRIEGYVLPYTGDYYLLVRDLNYDGGEQNYAYTLILVEGTLFEPTGAIAGIVYQEDGVTPAAYAGEVVARGLTTFRSWWVEVSSGGDYIIAGLPPGEYWVHIYYDSEGDTAYVDEWYDGAMTAAQATPVAVTAPDTTTGINFIRKVGGTIQGFVSLPEDYDYFEEPLFLLYDAPTGEYILQGWGITFAGGYRLTGIPAGTYKMAAISLFSDLALSYYSGGHSFDDPASQTITVTAGETVDLSVMTLETAGGIISGTIYDESGSPVTINDPDELLIIAYDNTGHFIQAAYVGWNPMTDEPLSPGTYQVAGLRTGSYYLLLLAFEEDFYVSSQWYSGVSAENIYFEEQLFAYAIPPRAAAVTVTDPGETANINFYFGEVVAVRDEKDGVPQAFKLEQNYPNPFNPSTTLSFDVPRQSHVAIMVYDLLGREVFRLVDADMTPGHHQVVWNGRSKSGSDVPTGLYIIRMVTPEYTRSIKAVYLK